MIKMPRKKKFEVRIEVHVTKDMANFLDDMVRNGLAESVSQAVRKCINVATIYMPAEMVVMKKEDEKHE